jgi:hypothetical protein
MPAKYGLRCAHALSEGEDTKEPRPGVTLLKPPRFVEAKHAGMADKSSQPASLASRLLSNGCEGVAFDAPGPDVPLVAAFPGIALPWQLLVWSTPELSPAIQALPLSAL